MIITEKNIRKLKSLGILKYILPEIDCMDKYPHPKNHHPEGNVFEHTMKALGMAEKESLVVRLSILFHDIGKPATFALKEGRPTFYGHPEEGLIIFNKMWKKYLIPYFWVVAFVIANHMRYNCMPEMRKAKRKRLMEHPYFPILEKVCEYDEKCRIR